MRKIFIYPLAFLAILSISIGLVAFTFDYQEHPFLKKITQQFKDYVAHAAPEKVYVQLDRSWYAAGDVIWLNAFLREAASLKASSKSEVLYVELLNPKSKVEKRLVLRTKDGAANGDFKLADNAPGGIYKIKAYTQWQKNSGTYFEKEIQVQNSVLPNLKMKLEFERKAFGPGSEVIAKLDLHNLENQALANHALKFSVQLNGLEVKQSKSNTDKEGRAYLKFNLPKDLKSNDGLLNVMINYNDQQESIARAIPIVLNDIDLQFLPEGGSAVADLNIKYAFKAINEFGKPADVSGIIYNDKDEIVSYFETYHQGMGAVNFTPQKGVFYYAKITQPVSLEKKYHLPNSLIGSYAIQVNKIKSSGVKLTLNSTTKGTVFLVAQSRGKVVFRKSYNLFGSPKKIHIPTSEIPIGIMQITLFDSQERPRCERLVFVNKEQQLKIEVNTDKEKYLPREKVKMAVSVKDENNRPISGSFSLAVADDKLLSFADDKQGHILASMLLESDLKTKVEEPNFYFDPKEEKADQALDYLMLTQGWRNFNWPSIPEENLAKMSYQGELIKLAGKVFSVNGSPIANAKLELTEPHIITHTKSDGSFHLPLSNFDYTSNLVVSAPGYEAEYIEVEEYNANLSLYLKKLPWTIKKEKWGDTRIEGQVIDGETGEELIGVNVILMQKGQVVKSVSTDLDGTFSMPVPKSNLDFSRLIFNYVGFSDIDVPLGYLGEKRKTFVQVEFQGAVNLNEVSIAPRIPKPRIVKEATMVQDGKLTAITTTEIGRTLNRKKDKAILPSPVQVIQEIPEEDIEMEAELEDQIVFENKTKENKAPKRLAASPMPPPPPPAPRVEEEVEEIFKVVEKMPRYYSAACEELMNEKDRRRCAQEHMISFIYKNVKYPKEALENCIEGTVVIRFVVDEKGNAKEFTLLKDIGASCGQAALKAFQNLPKFIPANQSGKAVDVYYNMPVRFMANGECLVGSPNNLSKNPVRRKVNTRFYQARTFYTPKYETKVPTERRTDFRSTIYWNPRLQLDDNGQANIEFYTSDDITSFRTTIEGLGNTGSIGRAEAKFYTQKPFNLLAKLPTNVLTGDQLQIPLTLINNTSSRLKGKLKLVEAPNLTLLKKIKSKISLKAFEKKTIYLSYLVKDELGEGDLKINFEAKGLSDGLVTRVKSTSRGFPVQETKVGGKKLQQDFDINILNPIDGSIKASLNFYPTALSEVISGMDKMLRHPHGCFEQTSSSNYPNLLVLDYLRSTGLNEPAVELRAKQFIKIGYERLVGFEASTGGFEWYGRDPGHEALTAYGIMQFVDMSKMFNIGKDVIERTSKWLLNRRDGKGGWFSSRSHGWYVNNEIGGAYVVWALCEAGLGGSIKKELDKSYQGALKSEDPYLMALIANALLKVGDQRAEGLVQDLLARQTKLGTWKGSTQSATRSRGKALEIETTAMTALALIKAKHFGKTLDRAIQFITQSKNNHGFGNTQSTIMALKALVAYAKNNRRAKTSGKILVKIDGKKIKEFAYEKNQSKKIVFENLEQYLTEGEQKLEVIFKETKTAMDFELDLNYTTRLPASDEACALSLETKLTKHKINMGENLRLTGTIKNKSKEALASPIAMIGIPAGLSPQAWQLKAMQERQEMAYYEIFDGYIVFYYDGLEAQEEKTIRLDLKADIPGKYEAPASRVYQYYQNEYQSWSMPDGVVIGK